MGSSEFGHCPAQFANRCPTAASALVDDGVGAERVHPESRQQQSSPLQLAKKGVELPTTGQGARDRMSRGQLWSADNRCEPRDSE